MKSYNLGIYSQNINDTTSLYRAGGPITALRETMNLVPHYLDKANNINMLNNDVILMQRPFNKEHLQVAMMAKRCKRPLWLDYDDFLFDVPRDNPNYKTYMNEEAHMCLIKILQLSDVVTVSTKTLKALYEKEIDIGLGKTINLAKNVVLVSNSYDPRFHGEPVKNSGNKLISWRGSKTHDRDLKEYADPIIEFLKENKDWNIEFMGSPSLDVTERIDPHQVTITESTDPFMYMEYFKKINPSIHIVPLHDSVFNRSKSNIAWIEATCAGASTIAPDWDGWRHEGVIRYKNKKEFFECLSNAANKSRSLTNEPSFDEIQKNYHLDNANLVREEIIRLLVGKSSEQFSDKIPQSECADLFGVKNDTVR